MPARSIFVVAALMLGAFLRPASAVEPSQPIRHAFALGLGARMDSVREDLRVPLSFYGPGFRLMVGYEGQVGPGVLAARADLGAAYLHNRFGHDALTIDYSVEATWTTRAVRGLGWHLAVGPALALDSRIHYLHSWDDAHGYWVGTEYLGPALRYLGRLGDAWRVESTASVALLGFLGRPPSYPYNKQDALTHVGYYFEKPFESQRFVGPQDLQVVRWGIAVRKTPYTSSEVGQGWSYGLEVRFLHTEQQATNIDLGATVYAARAWGW